MSPTHSQEIVTIPLENLRLWTENPRDPIDEDATDADIIRRAIDNDSGNWDLDKMLAELGDFYFYSSLPVVVEGSGGDYIVYDGNRRVAVLKCLFDPNLYEYAVGKLPLFCEPTGLVEFKELPCNVCDVETALHIVEATHQGSRRWGALQFEQFRHTFRGAPKGRLMALDEAGGGLVQANPKLNEEYVQSRLLSNSSLEPAGLKIENGELRTSLADDAEVRRLLDDVAAVARSGLSTARKNAGDLRGALRQLDPERYRDIKPYDAQSSRPVAPPVSQRPSGGSRPSRRVPLRPAPAGPIFGGKLRPRGDRSNQVYRAIEDIYSLYRKTPDKSPHFLPILGFSLRLLLEVIAQEYYQGQNPPVDHGDNSLKELFKEVIRPLLRGDSRTAATLSLDGDLLDRDQNIEGILGKWAHGALDVSEGRLLSISRVVGRIVKEIWSR